ncbi:MAG: DUF188 domain-containing protein [Deltaproteobacteria bacterium]|nr:DUF188 domain-containing protein [Deltaproteobacteria bacterium]
MTKSDKNQESRKLFIDADGFPHLKAAIEVAGNVGIGIVAAGNMTQNLGRLDEIEGLQIIEVSDGMDAADFAILNHMKTGDLVLTGDTGLAALVIGKGGIAIDARGNPYRKETIDGRLLARHIAKKIRRSGGKTKGPGKISHRDREKFAGKLERLLKDFKTLF